MITSIRNGRYLTVAAIGVLVGLGTPGAVRADNSCEWANDGECDDPSVRGAVTGLCTPGTDSTDCASPGAGGPNSCSFANDGECDDPTVPGHVTSACAPGTDSLDCGAPTAGGPNSCEWANDGECDDPTVPGHISTACAAGTDTADCSAPTVAGGPNSCAWANDGECDDPTVPGHITSACAAGTDQNDCAGLAGGGVLPTTFAPWFRITNDQRQFAAQPGGVFPLPVNGGSNFQAGSYVIYYGFTKGAGAGPIIGVQQLDIRLESNRRYMARTHSPDGVWFDEGGGALTMYSEPGPGRAMIYARNDDISQWRAICVLPAGAPVAQCGP